MPNTERLTHVEEIELIREYNETGNKKVLDKIVLANTGLVHKLTSKFPLKNCNVSYDDLFQEGIAGLIHGIKKFDSTKGYRLGTYTYNWIKAYISRYYQNQSRSVRVPIHVADSQLTLNKQVESLTNKLGRTPTMNEIIEVNPDALQIINKMKGNVSLNTTIGDDSELEDMIGEDKTNEFDTCVDCDIILSKLREQVSNRDYTIILKRFGLGGYNEMTLTEIGEEYELTRARIHQLQNKMLGMMRQFA